MNVRKYRVVCWQPVDSKPEDEFFIDIAPENGIIHNMMFYSRLKLFRSDNPTRNIVDRAGSIYLMDNENTNEIDIVLEQSSDISKERLVNAIINTYKKMRADGKDTTLPIIISNYETEKMAEEFLPENNKKDIAAFEKRQKKRRSQFAQKHFPQTPQEERLMQNEQNLNEAILRKKIAMQESSLRDAKVDPITRMKEKMIRYSGD